MNLFYEDRWLKNSEIIYPHCGLCEIRLHFANNIVLHQHNIFANIYNNSIVSTNNTH